MYKRQVFVKEIIPAENKVILSDLKALEKTEMRLKEWRITNPALLLNKDDIIEMCIRDRKNSDTPAALKRRGEMEAMLAWNKEAQDEMLGTDTEA